MAVNLVLTPYLIHGLGIDQYGLYALAATITIFLSSFDGGIGATAPRFFALYAGTDDRRTTTRMLCTLGVVIVVAGGVVSAADWVLSPWLASILHMSNAYRPEAVFLLRTFGVLITVSLLHSLFVAVLQARQRFALTSRAVMFSYLAWAAGLALTVRAHEGLRGVALSLVAEQVLATVLIVPSALRYLDLPSVGFQPFADVRHFFAYAARVQTNGIAALVNMELDALVIGAILPIRNVGLYNAGANVSTQLRYAATSVMPPLGNHLATLFGRSGEAATQAEMVRLQRLWVIGISGWCAAGLGASYFAVTAWLGPQFRISALVCLILLGGHSINLLTGMMTSYAGAIGKPGIETRYGVVGMVLNVALTVPLAFVGVLGVVTATAVGSIISSIYLLRVVHTRLSPEIPSFFADVPLLRSVLCAAVTCGLELLVRGVARGPVGLLVCALPALAGLTCYAVAVLGPRRSIRLLRAVASGSPVTGLLPS